MSKKLRELLNKFYRTYPILRKPTEQEIKDLAKFLTENNVVVAREIVDGVDCRMAVIDE